MKDPGRAVQQEEDTGGEDEEDHGADQEGQPQQEHGAG